MASSSSYPFGDASDAGKSAVHAADNPYEDMIQSCQNDPVRIQARYTTHRATRNAQQRAGMLSPDFPGMSTDGILARLEDPTLEPGFKDWRNCLVFWARPPAAIRELVAEVQRRLLIVAPNLWTMPSSGLHMTALEITHSLRAGDIEELVTQLTPVVAEITDYTLSHRARLVRPLLSYDAQALALSFVPATAACTSSRAKDHDDTYSYHHLRRDLFTRVQKTRVTVASRYVFPSAHITIARFITNKDFETESGEVDHANVDKLIKAIDNVNLWLAKEYWPKHGAVKNGGEWIVGEEQGLDCRKGTLWYGGGGQTVRLGKGF